MLRKVMLSVIMLLSFFVISASASHTVNTSSEQIPNTTYCIEKRASVDCNTSPTSKFNTNTVNPNGSIYITAPTLGQKLAPGYLMPIDILVIRNTTTLDFSNIFNVRCRQKYDGNWQEPQNISVSIAIPSGSVASDIYRVYCFLNTTYGITDYSVNVSTLSFGTIWIYNEYSKSSFNMSISVHNASDDSSVSGSLNPSNWSGSVPESNVTLRLYSQLKYRENIIPRDYLGLNESRPIKNTTLTTGDWWLSTIQTYNANGAYFAISQRTCASGPGTCTANGPVEDFSYALTPNHTHRDFLNLSANRTYRVRATFTLVRENGCTTVTCAPTVAVHFGSISYGGYGEEVTTPAITTDTYSFDEHLTTGTNLSNTNLTFDSGTSTFTASCVGSSSCPQVKIYLSAVQVDPVEVRSIQNSSASINLANMNHIVKWDLLFPNGTRYLTNFSNFTNYLGEINTTFLLPHATQAGSWTVNLSVTANSSSTINDTNFTTVSINVKPVINGTTIYYRYGDFDPTTYVTDSSQRVNLNRQIYVNVSVFNNPSNLATSGFIYYNGNTYQFNSCTGIICTTMGTRNIWNARIDPNAINNGTDTSPQASGYCDYHGQFSEARFNCGSIDPARNTTFLIDSNWDPSFISCPIGCTPRHTNVFYVYYYNSTDQRFGSYEVLRQRSGSLSLQTNTSYILPRDPRIRNYTLQAMSILDCRDAAQLKSIDDDCPTSLYQNNVYHSEVHQTRVQKRKLSFVQLFPGGTYNRTNSSANASITYWGEIGYAGDGLSDGSDLNDYYNGSEIQNRTNVTLYFPNGTRYQYNDTAIVYTNGFFNGTFGLSEGIPDGSYYIHVNYSTRDPSGDVLNDTIPILLSTPQAVEVRSNTAVSTDSLKTSIQINSAFSDNSSTSINSTDILRILSWDRSVFNRGETASVNPRIGNVRSEYTSYSSNLYLINQNNSVLTSKIVSTDSFGSLSFNGYIFNGSNYTGNYTFKLNDTDGNFLIRNVSVNNTVSIRNFSLNDNNYSSGDNLTYFTGPIFISAMHSWVNITNARDEISSQFDPVRITFNVINPKNGSVSSTYHVTYTGAAGNYSFMDNASHVGLSGNVTALVNISDEINNNTDLVNLTQSLLQKSLVFKYAATNATINSTLVLRGEPFMLNFSAYDSWNDSIEDAVINASHGMFSACTVSYRIYNDTRGDDSLDRAEITNSSITYTSGWHETTLVTNRSLSIGAKDLYMYSNCTGRIDGRTWNNVSNSGNDINSGAGLFIIEDLVPGQIRAHSVPGAIPVYFAGQNGSIKVNFTFSNLTSATNQVYRNMGFRFADASGTGVSGITPSWVNMTDSEGNVTFNFTIGNDVSTGRYHINVSTLYGTTNLTVYILSPSIHQFTGVQTRANGSAYYERNVTLRNNESSAQSFVIRNMCYDSNYDEFNSTDATTASNTLGSLWNDYTTYSCGERSGVSLASGAETKIKFLWKINNSVTMNQSAWKANNSANNTENTQHVYKNVTFVNNDTNVSFSNVSYAVSVLSGGSCYAGCNWSNHTVNVARVVAGANGHTDVNASAYGNFINVDNEGTAKGPSGVWESDTQRTSNIERQYIKQNITASLADVTVGGFTSVFWSVAARSDASCIENWVCNECSGRIDVPTDGSIARSYANSSGRCITDGSKEYIQNSTFNSSANGSVYVKGKLNITNFAGIDFLNITYNSTTVNASRVFRNTSIGNWSCTVGAGYIVGVKALGSDLNTNTTADYIVFCDATVAPGYSGTGYFINKTFGSEVNTGVSLSTCSYRYKKDINHTNRDTAVDYSTTAGTGLLSNVSVSQKDTNASANVTCAGSAGALVSLNSDNFTNFTIASILAGANKQCNIYWNVPGVKPYIGSVATSSVAVTAQRNISANFTLVDSDAIAGGSLTTDVLITPTDGQRLVDDVKVCSSLSGSSIECLFNPNTNAPQNTEKEYNLTLSIRDDSSCENRTTLSNKIYVDTKKPQPRFSLSPNNSLPSIRDFTYLNATFDDFNVSNITLSFLPNNSVNSSYINISLNISTSGSRNFAANYTFNVSYLNETYNTTNGTRVRYLVYAIDHAGNTFQSTLQSFYIPCDSNHRTLEIRAKPISVLDGRPITTGTATVEIYDSTGTRVDISNTAIRPEESGGVNIVFCKPSATFLIPGDRYKAIIKIKSGTETTYHVEEFIAPAI